MNSRGLVGRTYRSHWSQSLRVEVVDDKVEMRVAGLRPRRGVLYRRLDRDGEPLAVRSLEEFRQTFEVCDST